MTVLGGNLNKIFYLEGSLLALVIVSCTTVLWATLCKDKTFHIPFHPYDKAMQNYVKLSL